LRKRFAFVAGNDVGYSFRGWIASLALAMTAAADKLTPA
jgi:hypothetical protein